MDKKEFYKSQISYYNECIRSGVGTCNERDTIAYIRDQYRGDLERLEKGEKLKNERWVG